MKTKILLLVSIVALLACDKENEEARINTEIDAISITTNQATLIDDGKIGLENYEEVGFVYSENEKVDETSGTKVSAFCDNCAKTYSIATGLKESTTYYYRAYGRNGNTYVLSNESSFVTYSTGSTVSRFDGRNNIEELLGGYYWNSFELINDNIYSFGGVEVTDAYTKNTWKFDPLLSSWSKVAQAPEELFDNPGIISLQENAYVVSAPYNEPSRVLRYDAINNTWIKRKDFPDFEIKTSRLESFVFNDEPYIMVQNGNGKTRFYKYDYVGDEWELYHEIALLTFPGLHFPKGVVIGSKFYFQPQTISRDFFEFDIANKILLQKEDLPDLGDETQIGCILNDKILLASYDNLASFDPVSFQNTLLLSDINASPESMINMNGRIFFVYQGGAYIIEYMP